MAGCDKISFCRLVAVVAIIILTAALLIMYPLRPMYPNLMKNVITTNAITVPRNSVLYLAQSELTQLNGAFPAVWVNKPGELLERLQVMADTITHLREKILVNYNNKSWTSSPGPLRVVDGKEVLHLEDISISGAVIPVFLPWIPQEGASKTGPLTTLTDTSNLVIQRYFPWVANENLCEWIKSGVTNMRYHVVFNHKCTINPQMALQATSLELVTLNARPANKILFPTFPPFYYTNLPRHVVYIMLTHNAFFTNIGDLIADNVKYVPYTCAHDINPKYPGNIDKLPVYDEVFSISQYWGSGFYHKNIEDFPRLASFLPWLRKNIQIKIQVFEKGGFTTKILGYLGITADRLITGHIKARIGYLPESTFCGFGHVTNSQLLSKEYRNIIHNLFNQTKRSSIVLIRRSGTRRLTTHNQVEASLKKIAQQHQLTLELFIDNPVLPLEEAMRMFNRAVMVVAPHGAGLSNLMFAEPETFVIEGVCNRPHVNFCYQRQAYILGQHYHAVPSRRGCEGVIDIDAQSIEKVVQTYIPHALKLVKR